METQGIKYVGSKLKILPYILDTIKDLPIKTVLDGFSGTTRVSQAFSQQGYIVTSNDLSAYSNVFAKCYLQAKKPKSFYKQYIDELNLLKGKVGWFTENYSIEKSGLKKCPFQTNNLMKLDAIRERIEEYNLDEIDKSVLLTSLILALDKVDSTLGHFSSYLSDWSPRSNKDLFLLVPNYRICEENNTVLKDDIFNVIKDNSFDLAYYDPPYGSNNDKMPSSRVRYSSYYHFWTSVVLFDKPKLFGKANRREDTKDLNSSVFEEYKKDLNGKYIVYNYIEKLVKETKAKYIMFSYNNNGRVSIQELIDIFEKYGKLIKIIAIDYKQNIMQNMKWTNEWAKNQVKNIEYLFLLEKESYGRS